MSIVIVGGGISGLALAYYLSRKGIQVSIYEQADLFGGVGVGVEIDGKTVDSFYHVLTDGDTPLRQLIRDIGLEEEIFPVEITQGFFQDGKLFPASSLIDLLNFDALQFIDRLRLGLTFIVATLIKDWRPLDKENARDWLIKLGGKRVYDNFWRPIMTCRFGSEVDRISAADMWYRIHRTGVVTLRRGSSGSCYIHGSLKSLFKSLGNKLKELGVEIYLNSSVDSLITEGEQITGISFNNGMHVEAQRVVSTMPVKVLANFLPEQLIEYKEQLNQIEYLGNVCLILKTRFPISPYYQLNLGNPDMPFTGVIAADCLYPPEIFGGYITYVTRYYKSNDELHKVTPNDLLSEYLPVLVKICPDFQADWILDMAVTQTNYADHLHVVGYGNLVPEYITPISGLYLLSMAQVYPEPTVLDTAITNAENLAALIFAQMNNRKADT